MFQFYLQENGELTSRTSKNEGLRSETWRMARIGGFNLNEKLTSKIRRLCQNTFRVSATKMVTSSSDIKGKMVEESENMATSSSTKLITFRI